MQHKPHFVLHWATPQTVFSNCFSHQESLTLEANFSVAIGNQLWLQIWVNEQERLIKRYQWLWIFSLAWFWCSHCCCWWEEKDRSTFESSALNICWCIAWPGHNFSILCTLSPTLSNALSDDFVCHSQSTTRCFVSYCLHTHKNKAIKLLLKYCAFGLWARSYWLPVLFRKTKWAEENTWDQMKHETTINMSMNFMYIGKKVLSRRWNHIENIFWMKMPDELKFWDAHLVFEVKGFLIPNFKTFCS